MRIWLIGVILALSVSVPARAEWMTASSDHFVVYADQSESAVREFTQRLESYHAAIHKRLPNPGIKPSPSNRLTVYVVRNQKEVQKLFGADNRYLGGFYVPRAGHPFAIVPRVQSQNGKLSESEQTLLHEYAHHIMFGQTSRSYPLWVTEGFAEFYSTAKFEKDGSVGLGLPAMHRGAELFLATNVPIERLLDTKAYLAGKSKSYDEFYGRSWLLFHYLNFSEERKGQLAGYLARLRKGEAEIDAARNSFGDLKLLDKELNKYMGQRRMLYIQVDGKTLQTGNIAVRKLSAGEAAIMPVVIRSKRGVDEKSAIEVNIEARKIAAVYPADPAVQAALAETEFDAGHDVEAIAAADRALAADPQRIDAFLQKGFALSRQAESSDEADKLWREARKQFVSVNRLENDHPIPLIRYYQSFASQGKEPPALAIKGIEWALELAPYDQGLRWTVANQQLSERRFADAIDTLEPLAYSPHKSEMADAAAQVIAQATEQMRTDAAETAETSPDAAAK